MKPAAAHTTPAAARRSHRSLLEPLERRALLSASAIVPAPGSPVAPTQSAAEAGFVAITWDGHETLARPGQFVVRFDGVSGTPAQQLRQVNRRLAGEPGYRAAEHLGTNGLVLLQTPHDASHADVTAALRDVNGFGRAEPDLAFSIEATPNDPSYSRLWGLNNTGQNSGRSDSDIDAPEAWAFSTGSNALVTAVIDTGVQHAHPDLAANMWKNPGETAGDGVDNDDNGYVDDVFGYDFVNNDGDPNDDHGHGTHVAGTVAAVGDNNVGVAGVNWAGKVMALKFLSAAGWGESSDAIRAINYATMMKSQYGVNVRVTNNSWGGDAYSVEMEDAIRRNAEAGILFVAAAGNGGDDHVGDDNDALGHYPSNYNLPNVVAVAATDRNDARAGFSNYGAATVHLAAPGVSIFSTYPNSTGYGELSGTSMASPHVAGAASLAFSYNPGATMAEVKDALLSGTDPVSAMSGKSVSGGRLNAMGMLQRLPLPGDANGDGRVNLADFNIVASNFGRTSGATRATGDLNGDGRVNLADFNFLAGRFGSERTSPAATASATTGGTSTTAGTGGTGASASAAFSDAPIRSTARSSASEVVDLARA
jgi:subtilisin family serine protease